MIGGGCSGVPSQVTDMCALFETVELAVIGCICNESQNSLLTHVRLVALTLMMRLFIVPIDTFVTVTLELIVLQGTAG